MLEKLDISQQVDRISVNPYHDPPSDVIPIDRVYQVRPRQVRPWAP